MAHTLVIVESPAKAKKIGQLLGGDYTVKASVGHIRDLPVKSLGVDLESLKPHYEVSPDKKQTVAGLKRLVKLHSKILLATDLDREGEAIAWHLKVTLGLKPGTYKRVVYNEITRSAILDALSKPREIDMDMVSAQEARRVLDRLIGYLVSPALSNRAGKPLSAGRVQSVAVRMVVERERLIENFNPESYYSVVLTLADHPEIKAALHLKPWAADGKHIWDKSFAEQFCGSQTVGLAKQEQKPKTISPRPPLTTVEMQSVGSKLFGLSTSDVMKAAQSLFDKGHITYHRTDNPNLSDEGFDKIKDYLTDAGLPVAPSRPVFPSKADAQEAHEGIRPTAIEVESVGDSETEKLVYSFIRERAMLIAMPVGVDEVTTMMFQSQRKYTTLTGDLSPAIFVASGKVIKELGWRRYAKIEPIKAEDSVLPSLTTGQTYSGQVNADSKKTQPPGRYTEASLVKALEAAGIGRPSTYSAIVENIKRRQYIKPQSGAGKGKTKKAPIFIPGDLGYYVVDALSGMGFMNYKYTQQVESSFDKIAKGKMGFVNIVRPVYQQLDDDLSQHLTGHSLLKTAVCPVCSKDLVQRSKKGNPKSVFWVHRDEGDADQCSRFIPDQSGAPVKPEPKTTSDCPNCSKQVERRTKGKSSFWVHSDRADSASCGITFLNDVENSPVVPEKPKTSTCLSCGESITRRYSKNNNNHIWIHDSDEPSCGSKFLEDKNGIPVFIQMA